MRGIGKFVFTLFLGTLLCVYLGCNQAANHKKESGHGQVSSRKKLPPADEAILRQIAKLSRITLPFGSKLLQEYKLPKYWEKKPGPMDFIETEYDKKMVKIIRLYDSIYYAKGLTLEQMKSAVYVNMGEHIDSLFLEDIARFKFKCSYKYQLPNFGPFECYYQSLQLPDSYTDMFSNGARYTDEYYLQYDNLLFFNRATGESKLLNIYNEATGEERFGTDYKWFYIDNHKRILIYNADSNESTGGFAISQVITVSTDGNIIITNAKRGT